ncbi:peroxisomal biogenesis factor 19-like [Anneissia japonica]|uniref:peroxisomal biogenesis factor 19-like n=1 Tax=Anneissia japonica TaxID=1529436 RepID=UPI001425A896|nr:peroxisomal biogenesis factor 19-like [Anneissia japonica]
MADQLPQVLDSQIPVDITATNSNESKDETEKKLQENTKEIDPELDELLDSVLGDLEQAPEKKQSKNVVCDPPPAVKNKAKPVVNCKQETEAVIEPKDEKSSKARGPTIPPTEEAFFNELFNSEMSQEASKEFENALQDFMKDMGGVMGGANEGNPAMPDFSKMFGAQSFQAPASGTDQSGSAGDSASLPRNPADLSQTLGETFQRLSQTAQELQGDAFSEEEMLRSMGSLNLGGDGPGEGGVESMFFPMMQEMMQGLLSKEVLYPSLKEIVSKYPEWLENNKSSLEVSEFNRYSNQHQLMDQLCVIYESEQSTDGQEVKQQRFLKVIELVQKMEALGQPPKELAGDMPLGLDLNETGLPNIPGMPSGDQCVVM